MDNVRFCIFVLPISNGDHVYARYRKCLHSFVQDALLISDVPRYWTIDILTDRHTHTNTHCCRVFKLSTLTLRRYTFFLHLKNYCDEVVSLGLHGRYQSHRLSMSMVDFLSEKKKNQQQQFCRCGIVVGWWIDKGCGRECQNHADASLMLCPMFGRCSRVRFCC